MNPLIIVGILLLFLVAVTVFIGRGKDAPDDIWDDWLDEQPDGMMKLLGPAAKSMSGTKLVRSVNPLSLENLSARLRMSGAFWGDLDIFLSYQLVAFIAATAAIILALAPLPTLFRIMFVLLGVVIVFWPYNEVSKAAKKKETQMRVYLPDFAELLLMVLGSMSVPQALSFTAAKLDGPVAVEMRELVRTLSTRTMPEDQAFDLTADRLGTTEARQFVSALKVAYIDGAKAVEPIRAQVDNLRQLQFQHQRAMAKKLPVGMVVNFAIHFMPLLFILSFLPVIWSLLGVS